MSNIFSATVNITHECQKTRRPYGGNIHFFGWELSLFYRFCQNVTLRLGCQSVQICFKAFKLLPEQLVSPWGILKQSLIFRLMYSCFHTWFALCSKHISRFLLKLICRLIGITLKHVKPAHIFQCCITSVVYINCDYIFII